MLYLGYKFKIDTDGFELLSEHDDEALDLSNLPFKEGDVFVLTKTEDDHTYLKRIWTGSAS